MKLSFVLGFILSCEVVGFAFLTGSRFFPANVVTPTQATINHAMDMSVEIYGNVDAGSTFDADSEKNKAFCSGVVVADNGFVVVIATASHCVMQSVENGEMAPVVINPTPLYVSFSDGSFAPVITGSATSSEVDDIGFISVIRTKPTPVAQFYNAPVTRGHRLFVIGDSYRQHWVFTKGYATRAQDAVGKDLTNDLPREVNTFSMACGACGPGDSGGGVFDDETGELIGIEVAGGNGAGDMSFFEPVSYVESAMQNARPISVVPTVTPVP